MTKTKYGTELISEGCKSYHKALFAVMQFRKQVLSVIRDVVNDHESELAALAISKNELKYIDYSAPAQLQTAFDGSEAEVGLRCEFEYWKLFYYLRVGDETRPHFSAQCCPKNSSSIIAKLATLGYEDLEIGEDYFELPAYLPADGSVDLVTICDRVLRDWIELWTKVGGLQQFLPKPKKKKARPRSGEVAFEPPAHSPAQ